MKYLIEPSRSIQKEIFQQMIMPEITKEGFFLVMHARYMMLGCKEEDLGNLL
jgi:hypothetical protein